MGLEYTTILRTGLVTLCIDFCILAQCERRVLLLDLHYFPGIIGGTKIHHPRGGDKAD
jgi:hypothetical protein